MEKEEKNKESEKSSKEIAEEKEERKIVVPGEKIVSGEDYLPGDNTRREGNDILASKFGLAEEKGRLVKVIPLSGVYMPRRGNVIIGKVIDLTFNGWIIDINAPYSGFLSITECPKFLNKNELSNFLDINDLVACKVFSVKRKGIDLTIKSRGLGKLEGGMIIKTNSNKVPRIIGREGSMIKIIKDASNCDIKVGQNGLIWIKGDSLEDELKAKKTIEFITEKPFISGLTDKVKKFLEEKNGKNN